MSCRTHAWSFISIFYSLDDVLDFSSCPSLSGAHHASEGFFEGMHSLSLLGCGLRTTLEDAIRREHVTPQLVAISPMGVILLGCVPSFLFLFQVTALVLRRRQCGGVSLSLSFVLSFMMEWASCVGVPCWSDLSSFVSLSLSGAVGRDIWEQLCFLYAQQLEKSGEVHKACFFFTACQRPEEAVRAYRHAGYFREAYAVARSQLAPEDGTADDLLREYAHVLKERGTVEQAAKW